MFLQEHAAATTSDRIEGRNASLLQIRRMFLKEHLQCHSSERAGNFSAISAQIVGSLSHWGRLEMFLKEHFLVGETVITSPDLFLPHSQSPCVPEMTLRKRVCFECSWRNIVENWGIKKGLARAYSHNIGDAVPLLAIDLVISDGLWPKTCGFVGSVLHLLLNWSL